MHKTIQDIVTSADAKAFATTGPNGLNVIPVSMVRVVDPEILLFDFFMDKTRVNIQTETEFALSCWSETKGVQIKGALQYITTGNQFQDAVDWVATQNPDRVVNGLLVLSVREVWDISLGCMFTEDELRV